MKTLSIVCRMVGTTRKALRGYDEIGLLHPSAKTENGYWLYDDDAINKLRFIQIFADAGYERSLIKEILENPAADFIAEYDRVIASLEERRTLLSEQIRMLTRLKLTAQLPKRFRDALNKTDQRPLSSERFASVLKRLSVETPQKIAEADEYLPFLHHLTAVCCLKDRDPASDSVQDLVRDSCSYLSRILPDQNVPHGDVLCDSDIPGLIIEWLKNSKNEGSAFIEKFGEEGTDYLLAAFRIRAENLKNETTELPGS